MGYVTGFLTPVPTEARDIYRQHAAAAWPIFRRFGALGMRECWGVDVPDGEVTSFPMAVKKAADETVVFSWIEWPDKATADRCWEAMQTDPVQAEFAAIGEMPFDAMRMMWGCFEELLRTDAPAQG